MTTRALITVVAVLSAACTLATPSKAQPLVALDMVTVGDAGNAPDSTGYGAVEYAFAIGKYEVTIGQYAAFLNSVASVTSDSYIVNLWVPDMTTNLNIAGISRSGSGTLANPYRYAVIGSGNRPITYVNWFGAARFANWMHNGATNGASTETGAYTLNGATTGTFFRNADALWWIPRETEWYKAAYYKGGGTNAGYWKFPTQSDGPPGNTIGGETNQANYPILGVYSVTQSADYSSTQNYLTDAGVFSSSVSAYGTYDQGGNVWEWNDAYIPTFFASERGLRGGSWNGSGPGSGGRDHDDPAFRFAGVGFRMASVAATPSTNVILTVEKTTSLSNGWQIAPVTSNMITPAGELDLGAITNTNEFYRLKIRTTVE